MKKMNVALNSLAGQSDNEFMPEAWPDESLLVHQRLNAAYADSALDASTCYARGTHVSPLTPPDLRLASKREALREQARKTPRLEGIASYHDINIVLSVGAAYTLIGAPEPKACLDILADAYGSRFVHKT